MVIDKQKWDAVMQELYAEIPADEFSLVLQEVRFESCDNTTVHLAVNSDFLKDRVTALYLDTIAKKLTEHGGSDKTLAVQIKTVKRKPAANAAKRKPAATTGASDPLTHHQLNTRYTFDGFIIGDNNRYAANAALAIAKSPGTDYNPFLIYGGVGLGKTHLIQSVGNKVFQSYKKMKIIFVTAESFTNEFIRAIQTKKTTEFKNKYRYADLLLIDDIHFLQKKQETQEEIFHTFNSLYDMKKQMIFTCDRPVREIQDITDRLRNRFERGLTVDLQPPSYETRVAILHKKVDEIKLHKRISLPTEVLEYIAEKVLSNVRDLEAALLRLVGYSELVHKDITPQIAEEQLKDIVTPSGGGVSNVSVEHIQRVVANYFNISKHDLAGKKRTKTMNFPRQISIYISRKITNYSFTEIGEEFGGRDHSTVMYSCEQIQKRIQTDPTLDETIQLLVRKISSTWKSQRNG